jgi:hypothetical protein
MGDGHFQQRPRDAQPARVRPHLDLEVSDLWNLVAKTAGRRRPLPRSKARSIAIVRHYPADIAGRPRLGSGAVMLAPGDLSVTCREHLMYLLEALFGRPARAKLCDPGHVCNLPPQSLRITRINYEAARPFPAVTGKISAAVGDRAVPLVTARS